MAQNKDSDLKNRKRNSVTIKVKKEIDGKIVKIDTSFDANDRDAIEHMLDQLKTDHESSLKPPSSHNPLQSPKNNKYEKKIVLKLDPQHFSENEKDKVEREVEEVLAEAKTELARAFNSLRPIQIEISGTDTDQFQFDFQLPPVPEMPEESMHLNSKFYGWEQSRSITDQFEGLDSLDDQDHLIFFGDEGEKAPVFEKEIQGKNGQKAFVFKRTQPIGTGSFMDAIPEKNEMLRNLRFYPNPGKGRFDLSFFSEKKGNIEIMIFDSKGKVLYKQMLSDFSGEYSDQIDITAEGKGNYLLRISQGDKSVTKKIIVE